MSKKAKEHPYFKQATLLLEVMPSVAEEKCFALKGGTAINFFVRDMPRLSVDIDLTYLPIEDRSTSLGNISSALKRISERVKTANPKALAQEGLIKNTKLASKLFITSKETQVIIEPNLTLRGTVFGTETRRVSKQVVDAFGSDTSITVVSNADLYGGKICAALDRQHPRDLFDIKMLLENEGITDEIRKGFIVYLCGHDETMSQLLDPPLKEIARSYESQFVGMPTVHVELEDLLKARVTLIHTIRSNLTSAEKDFLIAFKKGMPEWNLLGVPEVENLPALQWKLKNIGKMKPDHHKTSVERLKKILNE